MNIQEYISSLPGWMNYFGFEEISVHPDFKALKVFKRKKLEATKFGNELIYIIVNEINSGYDFNKLVSLSTENFRYVNELMSFYSEGIKGFGTMMVNFNLFLTESFNNDMYKFSIEYKPKHFAAAEFPSILDLSTNNLYFLRDTPIWGFAYYDGYRKRSYEFFSPNSWQTISTTK
ncbi:MAG TPA: hypothetical protein DEP28_10295 [Bacteroidetes bacterium]|nr:hypothetical protein [Bacteroidota bacterium]HCN37518.1 hypothetical protein [Bacteroidota bacterium]